MSKRERAGKGGGRGRGAEEVAAAQGGRIGVRHGNLGCGKSWPECNLLTPYRQFLFREPFASGYLERMKFLLTNDAGIDAAGLSALLTAARGLGDPVVVAPAGPQSGVSHAVTTGTAVRFEDRGPDRYAVHGTPADCVRVGLHRLCPDATWVLSGINHGGNLGADVYYSGTVAAVREAVLHGWTGIAFSHYRRRELEFDWPRAARWTGFVLADLLARPMVPGAF